MKYLCLVYGEERALELSDDRALGARLCIAPSLFRLLVLAVAAAPGGRDD